MVKKGRPNLTSDSQMDINRSFGRQTRACRVEPKRTKVKPNSGFCSEPIKIAIKGECLIN